MDPITQQTALAAAGAGGEALYVDDVFSTYLYDGNGGNNPINNGIDLAGKGGMVWCKQRDSPGEYGGVIDTERGRSKVLYTAISNAELTTSSATDDLVSFNSDGFTLGPVSVLNANHNTKKNVSWTFRKTPGFFDVVTYTGDGTAGRTVAHSLGSVPGCIIIKETDGTEDWRVYHRSLGATKNLRLNQTLAAGTNTPIFNDTEPTSAVFTVGADPATNGNGKNFVAYLFAHDDQSFGTGSDESIIKCGSFTTDGLSSATINLGFEPQWLMYKRSDGAGENWQMLDVMRGWTDKTSGAEELRANDTTVEAANNGNKPTSTGFKLDAGHSNNATYVYVAIRRPHKPPEAATDVFAGSTASSGSTISTGFNVDWAISKGRNGTSGYVGTRLLTNDTYLLADSSSAEGSFSNGWTFDLSDSFVQSQIGTNPITFAFRRAPGFFDVVAYSSVTTTTFADITHNLGVQPELMIIKDRNQGTSWHVWSTALSKLGYLNLTNAFAADNQTQYSSVFYNTDPTATTFRVGTSAASNNQGGTAGTYVAYLFATLAGISKVGSYTGNGSAQDIDCGFTNGARFVMIKRTDGTGNWYVWDSVRGIVSGNDPYFLLNTTDAEVSSADRIDPLSSGFRVDTTFNELNANGGTYIFLAIA